jgi:hypothetical protein
MLFRAVFSDFRYEEILLQPLRMLGTVESVGEKVDDAEPPIGAFRVYYEPEECKAIVTPLLKPIEACRLFDRLFGFIVPDL